MQRLKFVNSRGYEIVFDNFPPFIFWKIDGLSIPPLETIFTQASTQNGYTLHDILLNARVVHATCHVHGVDGKKMMFEKRRELNYVCNPGLDLGTLIYTNDYGAWQIPAFCRENPYAGKIQSVQTLDISFECPQPFLMSADPIQFYLAYIEGGLEFPLETPTEFGLFGYRVDINNNGDANTPIEMYIDGGSLNPIIKNETTGEFIKLAKQLNFYDRLYINTDPENLTVSLITIDPETNQEVTTNAYGYLTDDSVLFKLIPGENAITFHSDDDNEKVRIRGIFYKLFVGV